MADSDCTAKKGCNKCGEIKSNSDFYGNSRGGLQSSCKVCANARSLERYHDRQSAHKARRQAEKAHALSLPFKRCPKCREMKGKSEFWKDSGRQSGRKVYCSECTSAELKSARAKARAAKPPAEVVLAKECRGCRTLKDRTEFYLRSASRDGLTWRCKACSKVQAKEWKRNNPARHKELSRSSMTVRMRRPAVRLRRSISSRLSKAMMRKTPGASVFGLLGYSIDELVDHVERQFLTGMSWENYGSWHLDHIVPLSSFDIQSVDDPKLQQAWGLPNLRPLWARDNLSKHANRTHLM